MVLFNQVPSVTSYSNCTQFKGTNQSAQQLLNQLDINFILVVSGRRERKTVEEEEEESTVWEIILLGIFTFLPS